MIHYKNHTIDFFGRKSKSNEMKKNRFVFFSSHWCDQNDHLKYEWTYHDGEKFGIEDIKDDNLQLNIQWIKQISGKHGGDWTTRIHVTPQV